MCNQSGLDFGRRSLAKDEVADRLVLEVGAQDMNGSLRSIVTSLGPRRYVGVDVVPGRGVDEICDAARLLERFGPETFDVVISTEMIEHIRDWRRAIHNMKAVLKPGGALVLTTRSLGYPYHARPDFWRYEPTDMKAIFGDMDIVSLESDPSAAGVFVKAVKTTPFVEIDLRDHALYSMITQRRSHDVTAFDLGWRWVKKLPGRVGRRLRRAVRAGG